MAELVLLIEDSPQDVEAVQRTLARFHPGAGFMVRGDTDNVVSCLLDDGAQRPDLVLLDLNLPGTDGRSVLAEIRARPELAGLPVVVLTSSTDPRDVDECYRAGANGYLFKPVDLTLFRHVLRGAFDYWLSPGRTFPP